METVHAEHIDIGSVAVTGARVGDTIRGFEVARDGAAVGVTMGGKAAKKGPHKQWKKDTAEKNAAEVKGVVLKVAEGRVYPSTERRRQTAAALAKHGIETDQWAVLLGQALQRVGPDARLILESGEGAPPEEHGTLLGLQRGAANGNRPSVDTEGQTTRFVLVHAGQWGVKYPAMLKLVGTTVTAAEIMAVMRAKDNSFLSLRSEFFILTQESRRVPDGTKVDHDAILLATEPAESYELVLKDATLRVRVPASAGGLLDTASVKRLALRAHAAVRGVSGNSLREISAVTEEDAERCLEFVQALSHGTMKSLFQKTARIFADSFTTPLREQIATEGPPVDTALLGMIAVGCTFIDGGHFLPQVQKFVRGATSAMKRTGVIVPEDAYPASKAVRRAYSGALDGGGAYTDAATVVRRLLLTALVTSEVNSYFAPESVLLDTMVMIGLCTRTRCVPNWRDGESASGYPDLTGTSDKVNGAALRDMAMLLERLGSFEGDKRMFRKVATMGTANQLELLVYRGAPHPVIPWRHILDQHTGPGIAHALILPRDLATPPTIKDRMAMIFGHQATRESDGATGFNPRRTGRLLDESSDHVRRIRHAQLCAAIPSLARKPPLGAPAGRDTTLHMPVDGGVLAGGVGPVTLKFSHKRDGDDKAKQWALVVVLGVDSSTESVMHTRTRSKDKPDITPDVEERAIREVRKKKLPYKSPILRGYTHASYDPTQGWQLHGKGGVPVITWYDPKTQKPAAHTEDIHCKEATLSSRGWLQSAEAMVAALDRGRRPGVIAADARKQVHAALAEVDRSIAMRVLVFTRQQYDKVKLPVTQVTGATGDDDLVPIPIDPLAYQCLLALSHIVPGALTPDQLPGFRVPDARLLRTLEQWIADYLLETGEARAEGASGELATLHKALFDSFEREGADKPREHQMKLYNQLRMKRANTAVRTGGDFISLDTGLGKSLIAIMHSLQYAKDDRRIQRVIWVTKTEIVPTLDNEIKRWFPGRKRLVTVVTKESPVINPAVPFVIVAMEDLSQVRHSWGARIKQSMLQLADTSFLVVDEVHTLYNTGVERNSHCIEVAFQAARTLAMTATPIADEKQRNGLLWIGMSAGFPVHKENQLVAYAQAVQAKVHRNITEINQVCKIPLTDSVRQAQNRAIRSGEWNVALEALLEFLLPTMCRAAVALAAWDRSQQRVEDVAKGGWQLVVYSDKYVQRAAELCNQTIRDMKLDFRAGARKGAKKAESDNTLGVVITGKDDAEGYNLQRLGGQLGCPLPGNYAKRKQMRGRINRLGQFRKRLYYVQLIPDPSILSILFKRHNTVQGQNAQLQELAMQFVAEGDGGVRELTAADMDGRDGEEWQDVKLESLLHPAGATEYGGPARAEASPKRPKRPRAEPARAETEPARAETEAEAKRPRAEPAPTRAQTGAEAKRPRAKPARAETEAKRPRVVLPSARTPPRASEATLLSRVLGYQRANARVAPGYLSAQNKATHLKKLVLLVLESTGSTRKRAFIAAIQRIPGQTFIERLQTLMKAPGPYPFAPDERVAGLLRRLAASGMRLVARASAIPWERALAMLRQFDGISSWAASNFVLCTHPESARSLWVDGDAYVCRALRAMGGSAVPADQRGCDALARREFEGSLGTAYMVLRQYRFQ
jgi:hypothetical protein